MSETYTTALASVLSALDWGEGSACIIGHKAPDTDSICSAVAYALLMQFLGHACEARAAGRLNPETRFVADLWQLPVPDELVHVAPDTRLILMDHAEYAQAVDGAGQARILQVIDHHGIGDISEQNLIYYKAMPVGSTCTIVFTSYRETGIPIPDETARMLLAGLISDTRNLKKPTTTELDRLVWQALSDQLGFTAGYLDTVYDGMVKASRDMTGLSDRDIFLSYFKEYKLEGVKLGIANLESTGGAPADEFLDRMLTVMPAILAETDNSMLFARLFQQNGTFLLYYGQDAQSVAEKAFGPSLREGICHVAGRLSRKTDIVPMLTAVLRSL